MDFLRLVRQKGLIPPEFLQVSPNWKDLASDVSLLEWRAAKSVEARSEDEAKDEVDSSSDRRVARAVTEAYVAKQVLGLIDALPQHFSTTNAIILRSLYELVCLPHCIWNQGECSWST